jgi:hypothetical protein
MTRDDHDDDGSTRLGRDTTPTGTHAGADVTSRMTGADSDRTDSDRTDSDRTDSDRTDGLRTEGDRTEGDRTEGDRTEGHRPAHAAAGTTHERYEERVIPQKVKTAKTSVAATFALVFGLAALFCALTGILAPAAVLFGIIGIVLGIAGLKMTKRLGVTGKGVAIGGLVTAVLGLLLGAAVLAGAAVYVNDQGLDRLQQRFDNAVENVPSGREIVNEVENAVP